MPQDNKYAGLQKGMAEGTRKTQSASASAKKMAGKTPASPIRKLLKMK